MKRDSKIYVAGHNGMVGSAIVRNLQLSGYKNLIFTSNPPYDLTNQAIVEDFFVKEKPEYVFLAAAKVGGIMANNTYRAQFIYDNLMIQNNILHQSYINGVKKLLFLGSSCIYPGNAPQPLREEYLLTNTLEYTNEPYAIAKIAGIKMCEAYNLQYGTDFVSVMPTNLYGVNDNYNLKTSHVLPAMIRKIHLGKCLENGNWDAIRKDLNRYPMGDIDGTSEKTEIIKMLSDYGINMNKKNSVRIVFWGTGNPFREFMHVDDAANACIFIMNNIDFETLTKLDHDTNQITNTHLNIGTGKDITLKDLAMMIKNIIGFTGEIGWDAKKPDGTFRKLLDVSKIHSLGWKAEIDLEEGIHMVYSTYANELITA